MQPLLVRHPGLVGALAVLVALLAALVGACALQAGPYLAHRKVMNLEWLETASPREQRETAELALGRWFGDPHDEFCILLQHGDASSIPYLKAAIAHRPASETGDAMTCTWWHAFDALERLEHPAAWAKRMSKPRPPGSAAPRKPTKPAKFRTLTGPKADLRAVGGSAGRFP